MMRAKFQFFFQISYKLQLLNNQLCQDSSVSFFEKVNKGHLKMCMSAIKNGLELVSSLQHWYTNVLEMFVIHIPAKHKAP